MLHRAMLSLRSGSVALLWALLLPATTFAAPLPACSEEHPAACDQAAFRKTFHEAKIVAVEAVPGNRMAVAQLTQTLHGMGKQVAGPEQFPEVTLAMKRLNTDGIMIGPAGIPLGTLLVYGPSSGSARGSLLWVEMYTGQPDMSWPAVVQALIGQFQAHASTLK